MKIYAFLALLAAGWLMPPAAQASVSWLAELDTGSARIQVELVPTNPFGSQYRPQLKLRGACRHEQALGAQDLPIDVWRKDDQHYALVDAGQSYLIDLARCNVQTLQRNAQGHPGPGYQRVGAFIYNELQRWVYQVVPPSRP